MSFQPGDEVWYARQGDQEEGAGVFAASVVRSDDKTVTALIQDPACDLDGQEVECANSDETDWKRGNVYLKDAQFAPGVPTGYDDLVLLRYLNDAELSRNLQMRFEKDLSYCYCGNTCVAINLFYRGQSEEDSPHDWQTGKVANVFSDEVKQQYVGQARDQNPPHIYAIVEEAFEALFNRTVHGPPKKQAIVITGESGAGKTFTTYKVLDYVDAINQSSCRANGREASPITAKIKATMPIMAMSWVGQNDDSSRFGKLYRIVFDKRTKEVVGAMVTPYLLEKSRVCQQSNWERGFHIFYQMIYGADSGLRQRLKLKPISQYHYLNRHLKDGHTAADDAPAIEVDGDVCLFHVCDRSQEPQLVDVNKKGKRLVDDGQNFNNDTLPALRDCGFSETSIEEILAITSGVLLLGNVQYNESEPMDNGKILDEQPLNEVAELWQVDAAQFKKGLLHGLKGTTQTNYSNQAAARFRDGLARAVYNDIFVEIIEQFSKRLACDVDLSSNSQTFMAVLDIFGFEFVEDKKLIPGKLVNSLEQFCINLCNEKLQNHFVECVFLIEIKNLTDEGLKVTVADFDFTPNDEVVDMLQNSRKSVIRELDEVCKVPSSLSNPEKADKTFKMNCDKKLKDPKDWTIKGKQVPNAYIPHKISRRTYQAEGFKISHYANKVLYDTAGWVEKNLDRVPQLCYECLCNSGYLSRTSGDDNSILRTFKVNRAPPDDGPTRGKKQAPATLVSNFRLNLAELVDLTLTNKECRNQFVRCIKPNNLKKPKIYSSALVLNQLQYTGMLDTLRIRKAGFPTRPLHQDFYDLCVHIPVRGIEAAGHRYKPLAPTLDGVTDASSLVASLLTKGTPFDDKHMFVGNTRVLLKDDLARLMDKQRLEKLREYCLVVQSCYRGAFNKHVYQNLRQACYKLTPELRRVVAAAPLARQSELDINSSMEEAMRTYLTESVGMIVSEQSEREMMRNEDEYGEAVAVQKIMSDLVRRKSDEVDAGRAAYDEYKMHIGEFDQAWTALLEAEEAAIQTPSAASPVKAAQVAKRAALPHSVKFKIKAAGNSKDCLLITEM